MSHISIYSDNNELISSWTSQLSSIHQVDQFDVESEVHDQDVIIIDSQKIDNNGELLALFNNKGTRFLVVGENWPEQKQINALVHGAAGYCDLNVSTELLLTAIECILRGDIWIQRHLIPKVIGTLVQMKSPVVEPTTDNEKIKSAELLKTLSNREMDVAKMIQAGENNKTIASKLHISERTVKAHLTSIFRKLNVTDRLHLALFIKELS